MKLRMIGFSIFLLFATAGLLYAAHRCLWGLSLDLEIRPIEVVTLSVTVGIALLVGYYLTNQINDLRAEKDLLIDDVRNVLRVLKSCRDTLNSCYDEGKIGPKSKTIILSHFHRLINGIDEIEAALGMSQCSSLPRDVASIKGAYLRYKMAATGGSFPSKPYSHSSISDQEQACHALNAELQSLVFKINKYHG
jgi:hypothetical protein